MKRGEIGKEVGKGQTKTKTTRMTNQNMFKVESRFFRPKWKSQIKWNDFFKQLYLAWGKKIGGEITLFDW